MPHPPYLRRDLLLHPRPHVDAHRGIGCKLVEDRLPVLMDQLEGRKKKPGRPSKLRCRSFRTRPIPSEWDTWGCRQDRGSLCPPARGPGMRRGKNYLLLPLQPLLQLKSQLVGGRRGSVERLPGLHGHVGGEGATGRWYLHWHGSEGRLLPDHAREGAGEVGGGRGGGVRLGVHAGFLLHHERWGGLLGLEPLRQGFQPAALAKAKEEENITLEPQRHPTSPRRAQRGWRMCLPWGSSLVRMLLPVTLISRVTLQPVRVEAQCRGGHSTPAPRGLANLRGMEMTSFGLPGAKTEARLFRRALGSSPQAGGGKRQWVR